MKIRNISPDALIIGRPGGSLYVEPDEVVEVPDEDGHAHVWRVDGIPGEFDDDGNQKFNQVASDLWVEVADLAPTPEVTP